ncbi:hypothetical protein Tco_1541192, partial [Tanacetum coccineum]
MLDHSKAEPMRLLTNILCQVGVTTIIAKFLILDMPIDINTPILVGRGFLHTCGGIVNTIDNIKSTFDGICHQTFRAAKTRLDTAESDSDDEEKYAFQRNKFGAPIYEPKPARKLLVFLDHCMLHFNVKWKPDYTGCFNKKEDSDGQWHAEIRLTKPYGNTYDQSFVIKKTTRKLAKYHKVTNVSQKDKIEAKRTKPSTGLKRAWETKAEGVYILNGPT